MWCQSQHAKGIGVLVIDNADSFVVAVSSGVQIVRPFPDT